VNTLNETSPANETHRELASRLNGKLGEAGTPFSLLTLLFEVAEYSEHEITIDTARTAIEHLTLIANTLKIQLRRDQTWAEFRTEMQTRAEKLLRQLGISPVKMTITPETAIVELPSYVSERSKTLAGRALEASLPMRVNFVLVGFCGRCGYRLEGSTVELENCPQCGRRLITQFGPNS
jgi:heterodisulfide reductase subunit B